MPSVIIDRDRCKGCELCVRVCPMGVLEMSKEINVKGYFPAYKADPHRCIGCRMCAMTCPDTAIEISVNGCQYVFSDY